MDHGVLEGTQISSLFPASRETYKHIETTRRNIPLPPGPKDLDSPTEHALFSSVFQSSETGTVLLRVLNDNLTLELISLSYDVSPVRFVFPALLVSSPGIFLWQSDELHILAVTSVGSLYRLVLPVYDDNQLWNDRFSGNWCREHHIRSVHNNIEGVVQVQGTHCVAISMPNGDLLRLETEGLGDDDNDDQWAETIFHHSSFLSSLTSFIQSDTSNGAHIISMSSHPQPTDIGHIWTLSRDRTLRLWTAKSGCVSARVLTPTLPGTNMTSVPESSSSPSRHYSLLEAEVQHLLRVFDIETPSESIPYVLAFMPTPTLATSGGFFHLCKTLGDQLQPPKHGIVCSETSGHCHLQDFMVAGNVLYTLWDRQGRSYMEWIELGVTKEGLDPAKNGSWQTASYAEEVELTPAYLDELLLSPGSLTDRCFEAIMRPGMFSILTLRTAVDQYTNACLSLPGPPAPQLQTSYATLGENIAAVVGCTVTLTREPQTGALQHGKYWVALKRDWEGFIARCREVERSARWPVALGVGDAEGILLVERERIGALVKEDIALSSHRRLLSSMSLDSQYSLLETCWTLRTKLPAKSMLALETRLVDVVHQEIAFTYADIIQDLTIQSGFRDDIDEGLESWITGRLQAIPDFEESVGVTLNVIRERVQEVKREEDEVEMAISMEPPPRLGRSVWQRALAASYIASTINARYELCLAVVTMLLFLSDDLPNWDPAILEEIFAVFRGVAMSRHIARRPAGELTSVKPSLTSAGAADEVIARLRNMRMSESRSGFMPTHSLIDRLLAQSNDTFELPRSAHRFLAVTGLFDSKSPAFTSASEVVFCERLRLIGYTQVARELLAWLPRAPAVIYVLARLWLDMGRSDDASSLFESLAGSCGALPEEDARDLASVLPDGSFGSQFEFYLHVSTLFKAAHVTYHEVTFSQLALSVAPPGTDLSALWYNVIKGYIDLAQYEDAYSALITAPYEKLKQECISQLVYRMCEENKVEKLMTFNFAGFADEVEDAVAFKARNANPLVRPFYSRILHTWYVRRGDYRNAALTMYQRARKLADLQVGASDIADLAEQQIEAYLVAMNVLSLLDHKNAWFVMPVLSDTGHEPRKRRKLSKHIPEDKYALGKRDAEIVEFADIRYEYTLLSARLELSRTEPGLTLADNLLISPSSIVMKLGQANRFNMAMSTARSLAVDMSELFVRLTSQCLRLSHDPDAVIQEDTSDWLLTDKVSSWPGTPADRGWRYLRQSLEHHDSHDTDYKYSKVVYETLLASDRETAPPPWLVHILEENHHEYLIRTCLRYEAFELALEHILSLVRKSDSILAHNPPQNAMATWLPYTLIDQVLVASQSQEDISTHAQTLQKEVRSEIASRVKRIQKLAQFS